MFFDFTSRNCWFSEIQTDSSGHNGPAWIVFRSHHSRIPVVCCGQRLIARGQVAGYKNERRIINTDAGKCQTFSLLFRASLAEAGKLCYLSMTELAVFLPEF
jgi:hypothetical protein